MFETVEEEDITFDQYAWIQNAVEKAGLGDELAERLEPVLTNALTKEQTLEDDAAHDMAKAIVMRCFENRAHLDVLAGSLRRAGHEWTYEEAEKNREFFGKLKGKDIQAISELMVQMVVAFFQIGLNSLLTSQRYSSDLKVAAMDALAETEEDESDQVSDLENSEK